MDYNRFSNLVPQSLLDAVTEALKGGQKKLDVDGDGKLEKSDFEKLRKNKKPEDCDDMQEGAKEDKPPFDPPYSKPGERKDEYGNKVKNVAKFLARKAMNTQKEEVDVGQAARADKAKKAGAKLQMDPDTGTPDHFTAAARRKKGLPEEVEGLDELSTDTMKSYGDKRARTAFSGGRKPGQSVDAGIKMKSKQSNSLSLARTKINRVRDTGSTVLNKEGTEQIDEISKATMGRYINKAKDSIDIVSYRQGHKEAHGSSAAGAEKKLTKRHKGIETAVKKLTKEESEQIDELSKATLGSYIKKASNQAFSKGYSGGAMMVRGDLTRDSEEEKAGEKNVHKAIKRVSGISKAVNKLKTEAATPGVAAGSLPNGEHMCATNIMHKEWKEGQPIPTMHAEPDANGLIEWYDVMFEHGIERVMTEDMEVLQAESHMHSKKKMKKEEVEHTNCGNPECCGECDTAELSQEELDFVASLNSIELDEKHTVKYALKNPSMGGKISVAHYDSKDDAEKFLQSVKKKGGNGVVSSVKEEVELDEARGRGRPSAASKAEEDEPEALGMQLRKAKSINKPVTFANKETKEVHPRHVSAFNDHMDARRTTQEKAAFQKRAHASHAEFVKAVSEKVPAKAKDTGEIIKYR